MSRKWNTRKKTFERIVVTGLMFNFREAFNHAWDQYKSPSKRRDPSSSREEVCHRVAWAAVERKYKKNAQGDWVEI